MSAISDVRRNIDVCINQLTDICKNEYKKGLDNGKIYFIQEMKQWVINRVSINNQDVLDYLDNLYKHNTRRGEDES